MKQIMTLCVCITIAAPGSVLAQSPKVQQLKLEIHQLSRRIELLQADIDKRENVSSGLSGGARYEFKPSLLSKLGWRATLSDNAIAMLRFTQAGRQGDVVEEIHKCTEDSKTAGFWVRVASKPASSLKLQLTELKARVDNQAWTLETQIKLSTTSTVRSNYRPACGEWLGVKTSALQLQSELAPSYRLTFAESATDYLNFSLALKNPESHKQTLRIQNSGVTRSMLLPLAPILRNFTGGKVSSLLSQKGFYLFPDGKKIKYALPKAATQVTTGQAVVSDSVLTLKVLR